MPQTPEEAADALALLEAEAAKSRLVHTQEAARDYAAALSQMKRADFHLAESRAWLEKLVKQRDDEWNAAKRALDLALERLINAAELPADAEVALLTVLRERSKE